VRKPDQLFAEARWECARNVDRSFVKHKSSEPTPAVYKRVCTQEVCPDISVIIPTSDADRDGYFAKLLQQVAEQKFQNFELIVVKGDPRQGRAINIGAALAKGAYLLTLDDDSSLPDKNTFSKLLAVMQANPDIGMAGGNNTIPADAPPFVRRVMEQVPRRSWKPVAEITDSDLAEHPCLIMRTNVFRQVGGENELIPRGLDPYLRQVFRKAGYRVCLVPEVIYHHLPPATWARLLRQFYRNGYQAAYVNSWHPEWVIETPSDHGTFAEHRPFWVRLFRFPVRMTSALVRGHWVWFVCQCCYACGFITFMVAGRLRKKTS